MAAEPVRLDAVLAPAAGVIDAATMALAASALVVLAPAAAVGTTAATLEPVRVDVVLAPVAAVMVAVPPPPAEAPKDATTAAAPAAPVHVQVGFVALAVV